MNITIVDESTLEQRRQLASDKLSVFFDRVPAALRERVSALPARISNMNARAVVKLQEVLRIADELFAHADGLIACAKGCGHCCHVSVPIADFEAQYIADNIGVRPVALQQSIRHGLDEFSERTPCPFLQQGACSIYAVRPLTCRLHVNFDLDNYWCLHENWKKPDAIIPRPTIHALVDAYRRLAGQAHPVVADIRDFFPDGKST
ncbi:flagellin N-methylase [mine drainage metagenome]|uniref:Flagellin N-methylase n=1 Tax=mine drainage metagenome TaxID=410659 RepID=A0A1J5QSY1_9ZZZZ